MVVLFGMAAAFGNTSDTTDMTTEAATTIAPAPQETTNDTTESTTEAATTEAPTETTTRTETTTQATATKTVYITPTGTKYHSRQNCTGLNNAKQISSVTLAVAESKGLTPCSKCH